MATERQAEGRSAAARLGGTERDSPQAAGPQQTPRAVWHLRRRRLLRMLGTPLLAGGVLVLLMVGMREQTNRSEALRAMKLLGEAVQTFRQENGRLPTAGEVQEFDLKARGSRTVQFTYDESRVLADSPPQTPLAYSPLFRLHYLPSGHAVLRLDGPEEWLTPEELRARLEERDRHWQYRAGTRG